MFNSKRRRDKQQLAETPEKSDRQITAGLGISHVTVAGQRKKLESVGQIDQQETISTKDGKVRPRHVERKAPAAIFAPTAKAQDNAQNNGLAHVFCLRWE
jgi:hypothetical protein